MLSNYWYVPVYKCHRLRTILTFIQYVSYHYMFMTLVARRWRGCWCSCILEGHQASDQGSRLHFNT